MNKNERLSKEERRAQILEAALNVFIKKGYNGSTTMDIAREAQISEVTLFRHFESKRQIFIEAIEPVLLTSLKETIEESRDLEPKKKLKYIFVNRIKFVSENQKVIKLILMESQINPEIADFNFISLITELLKNSIRETAPGAVDEDFMIRVLLGCILSTLYLPKLGDDEINDFVENLIEKISI